MLIQPTVSLGESWSKDRFDKMRRDTPVIRARVKEPRSRDSGNTIAHKEFPGGHLTIVGANSPVDLASRPIRIVLADEIDKYPPSAGKEGDPLSLAEERAATFWNRKSVRCCSPTVKDFSRIGREWRAGDMRLPYVACPHCRHEQVMRWPGVRWSKSAGEHMHMTAAYHCVECGAAWEERDRQRLMRTKGAIVWRQSKEFTCCGTAQEPARWDHAGRSLCAVCGKRSAFDGHASFWASKLYSPWEPLHRIVRKWLAAARDPQLLKTFVNTQLAEEWEESAERVDGDALMDRREDWGERVPAGVLVVTAGVDTQDDRLEAEIVGWGAGEESWSIDHVVLYGDPSAPDVWRDLDALLHRRVETQDGRSLSIAATCIDSGGHHTQAVYRFCKDRFRRRVWAIKGAAGPGRPVWPKKASRNNKVRAHVWIVGVDAAKDAVHARLRSREPGPGYSHFPVGREVAWFEQLTAERVVTKYVKGFPVRVWELPPGKRNEAFDCRVYAYAALQSLNVQWGRVMAAAGHREPEEKPAPRPAPPAASPPPFEPPAEPDPVRAEAPAPKRPAARRRFGRSSHMTLR